MIIILKKCIKELKYDLYIELKIRLNDILDVYV